MLALDIAIDVLTVLLGIATLVLFVLATYHYQGPQLLALARRFIGRAWSLLRRFAAWTATNLPSALGRPVRFLVGRKLASAAARKICAGQLPGGIKDFASAGSRCTNCSGKTSKPRWTLANAQFYLRKAKLAKILREHKFCARCLSSLVEISALRSPRRKYPRLAIGLVLLLVFLAAALCGPFLSTLILLARVFWLGG